MSFLPNLVAKCLAVLVRYGGDAQSAHEINLFSSEMNPVSCWCTMSFYRRDIESNSTLSLRLLAAGAAVLLMGRLSGVRWLDARRRFEREGRD